MKNSALAVLLCAAALGGCTHNLYMQGRTNGLIGTAAVQTSGGGGGDIAIALGGKTYNGRWVYAAMGGSITMGSATAFSGGQTATAYGSAIGMPTGGNGSILASTADGASLHCLFDYSEWTRAGSGACQDNHGEIYDLQIH
jgi:hypothetical protein